MIPEGSVAAPDPVPFDHWIPDHISESLETIFWMKVPKFFDADPDPGSMNLLDQGSGMLKIRIQDPG
jgi:hypothetical protein